uniref:Uncharacterized protein n=1 Tax=Meloidogyne javanica TaxID=6303 RepID=A0A915LWA7_MELJA
MYTTKVQNITVPDIIICPVRQFRSVLRYEGPPDFLHIVSHYYNSPKQVPIVDGLSINATTMKALTFSQNFLKFVSNLETNLAKTPNNFEEIIQKLLEKSEKFINNETFEKLFPHLRKMLIDSSYIYLNYNNFHEWQLHNVRNDSCFKKLIGETNQSPPSLANSVNFIKFIKCRAERIVDLLTQIIDKINNFEEYAHNSKPSLEEYVIFCRWLDGGLCVLDWIESENGVDCIKIRGKNKIVASYITLRNDINIILDLFALDNQLSTWDNRELRIILSGDENEKSVCTNIDGFA